MVHPRALHSGVSPRSPDGPGTQSLLHTMVQGRFPHHPAQGVTCQACSRQRGCSVDRWTWSLPCGAQRGRALGTDEQALWDWSGFSSSRQAVPSCGQSLGWAGIVRSLEQWLPCSSFGNWPDFSSTLGPLGSCRLDGGLGSSGHGPDSWASRYGPGSRQVAWLLG